MTSVIFFRNGGERDVAWPLHVRTEPGWLKILEHYDDPSFGDMGISGDREVAAIPSDLVARVEHKQVS